MSLFDDEFDCRCRCKRKCHKKSEPDCRYMKRCWEKNGRDWDDDSSCDDWDRPKRCCHKCDCRCKKRHDCDCHHKKHDCDCHNKKRRNKCDGCACEVLKKAGRGVAIKVVTDSGQVIYGQFFGFDKDDCCVTIKVNPAVCTPGDGVKEFEAANGSDIVFVDCRKVESVTFMPQVPWS